MKQFKGNRNLDVTIQMAEAAGYEVDTTEFDKGDDGIWLRDMSERFVQVRYNTCTGRFMAFTPIKDEATATESSVEFEGVDWYDELLEMFYEPLAV